MWKEEDPSYRMAPGDWQMWSGGLRGSYVVVAAPVLWWHRGVSPCFVLKSRDPPILRPDLEQSLVE